MSGKSFGLLTYPMSHNLGDEIQSIAARRFLPRVDRLVDRDALDTDPGRDVALILNGWFLQRPRHWPPHPRFAPLITSFHLDAKRSRRAPWRHSAAERLLRPGGVAYLKRHGPIGARDPATLAMLHAHGIESYHSGCLTLTLQRDDARPRDGGIVACDLAPDTLAALCRRVSQPVTITTHIDTATIGPQHRFAAAQSLLNTYARAEVVVTSRLHCLLPCLALGTPVLFVTSHPHQPRLEPAMRLGHACTDRDFIAGRDGYDLAAPPPNPTAFTEFRDLLIERCASAPQLAD
ncbi:MAG: polysaccharide pyruvyl transferase family protein [Sphingomonas sp.]|uniref:polysaccharide pyruvyl transferase family protein n=1 Tax=Sphingomonas sp. TaxID=28214 RepID=UPI0012262F35|nr:polysaccharide pyruvyl transferase family protein [Sphingomonas sp.]THD38298.1 MAG: polysaccharide pyruvyl transferase family protein [Sphingomonas sp.]